MLANVKSLFYNLNFEKITKHPSSGGTVTDYEAEHSFDFIICNHGN